MRRIVPLLTGLPLIFACNSAPKRVAEAPPVAYQATPQGTPVRMGVAQAPKLNEVQDAVKRVFKEAAVVQRDYDPSFIAGDFNGDESQDLAVIIKPIKLDEMNQELPPWLVRDPLGHKPAKIRLAITKDEPLLAVIHGYGTNDWRDPEATQAFVLKNAVGHDLRVQSGKEFVAANSGKNLPRPAGDLIGETLQGNQGYLYYARATYSWYDPKTFRGDTAAAGMVHGRRQ
jgi:hypothetical protein